MGRHPRSAGIFEVNPDSLLVRQIHLVEQQADFSEQSSNALTVCADPSLELEHLDSVAHLIQGCIHDQECITAAGDALDLVAGGGLDVVVVEVGRGERAAGADRLVVGVEVVLRAAVLGLLQNAPGAVDDEAAVLAGAEGLRDGDGGAIDVVGDGGGTAVGAAILVACPVGGIDVQAWPGWRRAGERGKMPASQRKTQPA